MVEANLPSLLVGAAEGKSLQNSLTSISQRGCNDFNLSDKI